MMPKIFMVEDDDNIRELVLYALKSEFDTRGFSSGAEFWAALKTERPDLVLLDIMLPGEDGLALLRRLRGDSLTRALPVVLLTAKGSEYDRVKGLDEGADDYITKPFSVLELRSRVKALLRRVSAPEPDPELRVGQVTVSAEKHTVTVGGMPVALTYKEFELLLYLCRNRDLALSRDRLMGQIWGFDFEGESRTVDMHIKTLRAKLGPAGDIIRTVRGVGYKVSEDA